jgi:GTP-binding protein
LIEGAHLGAGLGHQFLRHIERTRLIVHLLDGMSQDPLGDYDAINQELELFNAALAEKPQIVVMNKLDLTEALERWPDVAAGLRKRGVADPIAISAVSGEGVQSLLRRAADMLAELPPPPRLEDVQPLLPPTREEDMSFAIEREPDGAYRVRGRRIERIVKMTRWEYYDAVMRFQRILKSLGITDALLERGVQEGDTVRIGDKELEWSD